jgi:electron transfer flavoprotein beta subunit
MEHGEQTSQRGMMRVIVCVKQICLTYARTGMDPGQYFLAPEDKLYRVNPYDEAALELALQIKEIQGSGEIILLTLGPIIAEAELRRCLARGADDIYQIDTEGGMDPWDKSRLLARVIGDMGADFILCGKESLDKRNGQVGAFIAQHLGMPFVSVIVNLTITDNATARAKRSAGRGVREAVECPLPAVFSVDLGLHEPRLVTYEGKRRARSIEIRRLDYREWISAGKTTSMGVLAPRPRPKRIPPPDSRLEAYDRIQQILSGSRVEKQGAILRGDAESQAEGIISFLDEHGFLEFKKVPKEE